MDSLPKKKSPDQVLSKYFRDLLFEEPQRSEALSSESPESRAITPLFSPTFFTPVEEVATLDDKPAEPIESVSLDVVIDDQEFFSPTEIAVSPHEVTRSAESLDKTNSSHISNNSGNKQGSVDPVTVITGSENSSSHSSSRSSYHYADYTASEWLANGRPSWAEHDFDLLLCRVNGFSLAVPLITLGQIYEITDELTPIIGQTEWFMGFQPIPGGKVRVVNTALYVMPERYDRESAQPPTYVLTIDGIPWGLSLNSVDQPIRVKTDAVKWRKDRTTQPWMAGVVKDHMCVLLDIPTLGRRLLDSDKKLRQPLSK